MNILNQVIAVAGPASEQLSQLNTEFRALNFAFCGASASMQAFADTGRRFIAIRGWRREPAQHRLPGARGRTRILKARRLSQGFRAA